MTTPAASLALVTLDGSGAAEAILPWAAAVGKALHLRLLLLRLLPADDQSAAQAATHYLDGVATGLRNAGLQVETSARPADGDVPETIARLAQESSAELTMIATRGRTGMTRMLLGSVTTGIVHAIEGAVLVVKAGAEAHRADPPSVRRVLLTLDGSEQAEAAIPQAVRTAQGFGATLNVVQVAPLAATMLAAAPGTVLPSNLDDQIEQSAADYLRGAAQKLPKELPVELHVLRGPVADEILDHAERTHADLIVMSTRGRSGVARWTLGSTADRVLRGGSTPVLLVRARGEGAA